MVEASGNDAKKVGIRAADRMVLALALAGTFRDTGAPEQAANNFLNLVETLAMDFDFSDSGAVGADLAILRDTFRDCMVRYGILAKALATGEPFDPSEYQHSFLHPD